MFAIDSSIDPFLEDGGYLFFWIGLNTRGLQARRNPRFRHFAALQKYNLLMRVISGKAKGHKLQMVPGEGTRPITDRAKEALFSILDSWIIDTRVLDLFAGTGAVGIEALSRGGYFAHFIDRNRKAIQTIEGNLRHCKLADHATVEQGDSFTFLRGYQSEPFDLIYIAPPQYKEMWRDALKLVDDHPHLLAKYGTVIIQIHPREQRPIDLSYLEEYDQRKYGSVLLIFYAASEELAEQD